MYLRDRALGTRDGRILSIEYQTQHDLIIEILGDRTKGEGVDIRCFYRRAILIGCVFDVLANGN